MEPDVMPLHSTSPPPLNDDDEEVGAEEDEFGDFGGFSLGVSCFVDSPNSPSSLSQPRPSTTSPATHPPNASFNHPVEQSQPASTVVSAIGRGPMGTGVQHCDAEPPPGLANGYPERDGSSDDSTGGSDTASVPDGCSPGEGDPGFADFTAFAEQAVNPWCCGFSPAGGAEPWDSRAGGTNDLNEDLGGELPRGAGQEVVKDPGSLCAATEEGRGEEDCTKAKHCEQRDIIPVQSSQDHQPQDATAVSTPPTEEEELGEPGDSNRERRPSLTVSHPQGEEAEAETESGDERTEEEDSVSTLPPTASLCESVSEDFASFCDVVSPEGLPEDFHPGFSSPACVHQVSEALAQETDGEEDEDEDEDARNIRRSDSFSSHGSSKPGQSEAVKGLSHLDQSESMVQETPTNPNQSETGADAEAVLTDKEGSSGGCRDQECGEIGSAGKQIQANIPPSDSFADFCSAPTEGDGEAGWAEFRDTRAQTEGKTWAQFQEDGSPGLSEGTTEVEHDGRGGGDSSRRNSSQGSLSSRVQKLLQASFPEALGLVGEEGGGEEDVPSLSILLQTHDSQPEDEEQSRSGDTHSRSQVQWGVCQHQDVHSALALKFQWGGSHSNRTLLRCLGVETRNIVFAGEKKQPLIVPAFASNLGMLEPTKEAVTAAESLHTEEPLGSPARRGISTGSTQVLSSSQLNLSSHGLSSSQDGCPAINLDYFGPTEESSSSNSSRSNSPPPGVDPDLYELTISKLETTSTSDLEDNFNRLMSTAGQTCTSVRKSQQDKELSEEAIKVVHVLPNLSFMLAKVLTFPSVFIVSKECSPQALD